MAFRLVELELARPLAPITLSTGEEGLGLVARFDDRLIGFAMLSAAPGATIMAETLEALAGERFAMPVLRAKAEAELRARWPDPPSPPAPSLTIAICTKDRAMRLARLLRSLEEVRITSRFATLEILVVDNAPSDGATAAVAADFPGARYVLERRAGLDFARNAALAAATGDLLAFLDDDVVVDRHYLEGLFNAWRRRPDAGGFTGLVLPFRLETEAQIHFERRGGFGRGFAPDEFRAERRGNALHPVGTGILGAGCNMCFDRRLLLELGGFDDALDTGAPLPGGGDLDIFYRVLRSGRPMVYEPTYAVYHEHRETIPQLRRQYWSWGLGFMAFISKCRRSDPELRARQVGIIWWWMFDRLGAMARAGLRMRSTEAGFAWAEMRGGLQGLAGEYERSRRRVQALREQAA